ncbi:glycosyltransferase [Methylomonas sp. HYX-M1]|uniref:glycosyltransferase n=1 Tax=Methylomonas sp. HYX-M1 TaxID=3139307 RepID=UPI00345C3C5F
MQKTFLNIGCGRQHITGFVNMDIVKPYDRKLDARKGLPFPECSVDGIYSEHFFEHLTQAEGLGFLRECRRVLKPGGVVRIAMPDLDDLVRRYTSEDWRGDGDMFKLGFDWVENRCEMMNIAMREWGHKHVYNEEELVRIARYAGLEPIGRCRHGCSDIPELAGRETRNSSKLIMEFTLPARSSESRPLVSVLIPAYRADYFRQALTSALSQTYSHLEIIVCDDSANNSIESMTRELAQQDGRVTYIRNQPPQGGLGNYLNCFARANGEFIKFLNDDDVLEPNCIEKMLNVFAAHPGVTLVTSKRVLIDSRGERLPDLPATQRLCREDSEMDGISCANALIAGQINFLGEPSTAMFRKIDLAWVKPHFMSIGGLIGIGAGDVAMWLNLLGRGNGYYIAEPLSYFRLHEQQRQQDPAIQQQGQQTWRKFIFQGRRLGLMPHLLVWGIRSRSAGSNVWRTMQIVTSPLFLIQLRGYFRIAKERYLRRG